ncbi:hypothetical protein RCL1_006762 [Eukaryota sp. TZLM3-RCL]
MSSFHNLSTFIPIPVLDSASDSSDSELENNAHESMSSMRDFVNSLSVSASSSGDYDPLRPFRNRIANSSAYVVSDQKSSQPLPVRRAHSDVTDVSKYHNFLNNSAYDSYSPIPSDPSPLTLSSSHHASSFDAKPSHASRTIFVSGPIACLSVLSDQFLWNLFSDYGDIRSLFSGCKSSGFVIVTFFDLNDAKSAQKLLNGRRLPLTEADPDSLHEVPLSAKFSVAGLESHGMDNHHGTLVVFNLPATVTDDDLMKVFASFGLVKEIRQTPHKNHHRFIEFFDIRNAENAQKTLNKSELFGRRVKIEASRPGGRRSLQQQVLLESQLKQFCNSCSNYLKVKHCLCRGLTVESVIGSKPQQIATSSTCVELEELKVPVQSNLITDSSPPSNYGYFLPADRSFEKRAHVRQSNHVSDDLFDLSIDKILSGEETRCTLMIRNIPNKYQTSMLLSSINRRHRGSFNFFYLPIDFKNLCNYGYAFLNLVSPHHIVPFYREFHGKRWDHFNSTKLCELKFARIQGLDALFLHFRNSSLLSESNKFRPLFIVFPNEEDKSASVEVPLSPSFSCLDEIHRVGIEQYKRN